MFCKKKKYNKKRNGRWTLNRSSNITSLSSPKWTWVFVTSERGCDTLRLATSPLCRQSLPLISPLPNISLPVSCEVLCLQLRLFSALMQRAVRSRNLNWVSTEVILRRMRVSWRHFCEGITGWVAVVWSSLCKEMCICSRSRNNSYFNLVRFDIRMVDRVLIPIYVYRS